MSAEKKIIGARLRAAREEDPYWSRGDLARLLRAAATDDERRLIAHVPSLTDMIKQWEAGRSTPGPRYRRLYARALGRTEAELFAEAAAPGEHRTRTQPVPPSGDKVRGDTDRRDLLLSSAVTAGAAIVGLPVVTLDPDECPNAAVVAELRRLVDLHRDWLYEHGASVEVQHGVARLLKRSSSLLPHARNDVMRRDLLGVISDVSGVAAYTCRDLGLHDVAGQHYVVAVQAAMAAGDRNLAGHLVVRMAGHQVERADADQILAHLQAAAAIGRFTPRQVSNQHALAAWAHAMRGDASRVRRLVGEAEDAFSAPSPLQGAARWESRHGQESELFSLTGAGFATLSVLKASAAPEAISRLTRALELRGGGFSRNTILDHLSLADAYLNAHELRPAVEATSTALRLSEVGSSRLVSERLLATSGRLRRHSRNPDIADLIDLINKEHRWKTRASQTC
ncbi:hypothetical protein BZB76_1854 [Actinomadura pelletieri DSM 43383]|uniref:Transcriptional regulator n=1 Tax=Actinomadura pelletieri DSM 43383 TaxID=1120940 RepID=A0A495QSS8_9ACTN|nr:hypothetical protein [Actinomadura pelletieri]RKS76498.1 hypothetical protein BZB76_1854 [Actinomadura pelletieri DSM 43383]